MSTAASESGRWTQTVRGAEIAPGPARAFAPADLPAMLWRERRLIAVVFAVLALLGLLIAFRAPSRFEAHSSLLIRLGPSYVYQPEVGDAARGAAPDNDAVVQSELEILGSDAVKVRVVKDVGLARLVKGFNAAAAADPAQLEAAEQGAMRSIAARLKIQTAPGTSIARLTYTDSDPERGALVLNTLVDEYLRYRKTVLSDNLGPLDQQRLAAQRQLDTAEAAYQAFLSDNGIGDFDAERTSLAQIFSQLMTDQYAVRAQIAEVQGRLGVTRGEMARSAPEIGLYHDLDHTAQDKLAQLRVDRQDLLSRYQPTSEPVRDIERKIAAEEELASAPPSGGARRVGVNPVYQSLQTDRNQLEAQLGSLRDREAALTKELADATRRRQTLTNLEPRYDALLRERDLLSASVKNLSEREQESRAAQGLERDGGDDSIRVVERAYPATRGLSLRLPLAVFAFAFAAFAAVCSGLFRAFLRPGWPSRAAAERAIGLPVLATLP